MWFSSDFLRVQKKKSERNETTKHSAAKPLNEFFYVLIPRLRAMAAEPLAINLGQLSSLDQLTNQLLTVRTMARTNHDSSICD